MSDQEQRDNEDRGRVIAAETKEMRNMVDECAYTWGKFNVAAACLVALGNPREIVERCLVAQFSRPLDDEDNAFLTGLIAGSEI